MSIAAIVLCLSSASLHTQAQSVPLYPSLTFNSPELISGIDGQVDAIYRFPNVMNGVDAFVTVMQIGGGARLVEIDNTTGAGYYDAFQPYVAAAPNDTSYIDWKIVFKKAGTSIDTILPLLAVTGVDVDGDGSALKEFIQAATPGSFALEPDTYLNFSFDGVRSTATSKIDNYPLIDTAQRKAMFQMNFTNINTILYRNGAISTYGAEEIRQTCIYFKSFFNVYMVLPVKLISFAAKKTENGNAIQWSASAETDLDFYTLEKSSNGYNWKDLTRVNGTRAMNTNSYQVNDAAGNNQTVYYRLRLTAANGGTSYSKTVEIISERASPMQVLQQDLGPSKMKIRLTTKTNEEYSFGLYSMSGTRLLQSKNKMNAGNNLASFEIPYHSAGIYVLVISNSAGQVIYNNKIVAI